VPDRVAFPLVIFFCFAMFTTSGQCVYGQTKIAVAPPFVYNQLDVRAMGMANVSTAVPDLACVLDANPALLMSCRYASAGFGSGEWLPEFEGYPPVDDDQHLTLMHGTLGSHSLGLPMAIGLGYKRIRERLTLSTTTFQLRRATVGLSLAARPIHNVSFGYSVRRYSEEVEAPLMYPAGAGNWWAHDFGVYLGGLLPRATITSNPGPSLHLPFHEHWSLDRANGFGIGFSIRNLSNRDDPIPENASLGLSWRPMNTEWVSVLLIAEIERQLIEKDQFDEKLGLVADMFVDALTLDSDVEDITRWGVELNLLHLLDARLGHLTDHRSGDGPWTYGLGIGTERIQLNYGHSKDETIPGYPIEFDMWQLCVRW